MTRTAGRKWRRSKDPLWRGDSAAGEAEYERLSLDLHREET